MDQRLSALEISEVNAFCLFRPVCQVCLKAEPVINRLLWNMQHRVVTDYSNVENETVKVFVRLRPPADGSNVNKQHIKDLDKSNKITILDPRDQTAHTGNEHTFAFNEVFNTDTNQEDVFLQ